MIKTISEGKTEDISAILANYGKYVICDCVINHVFHGVKFNLYYPVKIYTTEKRRKFSRWSFFGCSLVINDSNILESSFCYNGKVYERIRPLDWKKNKKIDGLKVYSPKTDLSIEEKNLIKKYINWVDKELSVNFSSTYAFYFTRGILEIIFWDPDIYSIEEQLDCIDEALRRFQ